MDGNKDRGVTLECVSFLVACIVNHEYIRLYSMAGTNVMVQW